MVNAAKAQMQKVQAVMGGPANQPRAGIIQRQRNARKMA
jgi:hypothetical protein